MNLSYNNNEPAANNNPSNSQGPMLTNTKSINSWVDIDHHGFGDPIGGYHKIIHQDTASPVQRTVNRVTGASTGIPNAIPNINQFFAANVVVPASPGPGTSTDTQLFSVTGGQAPGQFSQLTGNLASDEGYMWASGILIQWGRITGLAFTNKTAIVFNARPNCINFPTGIFTVITNFIGPAVLSPSNNTLVVSSISQTGFVWNVSNSTGNTTGFYWVAIGN